MLLNKEADRTLLHLYPFTYNSYIMTRG